MSSDKKREDVKVSAEELRIQREYIKKIGEINELEYKETGVRKTFYTVTFGCQMNAHDSEKLDGMLFEMGYTRGESEKTSDLIVYNTCCVRENAENKVYGNLGYLKHMKEQNKNLKIVVCGCMMQQESVIEKIKKAYRHVDVIFGTFNLYRFAQLLHTNIESGEIVIDVWKEHQEIIEDLPSSRHLKFKTSVNIMFGCNNFCSYCIVPYVRGRERSREIKDILIEIENLAKDGVKEVTLLGQNVNSYGKGLAEEITFAHLLREINKIDGIERIRFMTSHPKDLSDELIYAMRDCEKVCNHIHLPIQSGSTDILEKMNRKYTKEHYLHLIEKIKKELPEIFITTDIIVGFPGETDADLDETIDLIKTVRFSGAFTFQYSKRTGTPASNMENQVPQDVITKRFQKLLDELNPIIYEINESQIGKTVKVLAEEINKQNESLLTGRAENNSIIHFEAGKNLIGEIVNVEITEVKTFYSIGKLK